MVYRVNNLLENRVPKTQSVGTQELKAIDATHLRARLGLSGRMAVKSLQESDLCDRHPNLVLMPLFLQWVGAEGKGYHGHNCQL